MAKVRQERLNRPGFRGGSNLLENGAMYKTSKFSLEVRERAVRMVQEHRGGYPSLWATVASIAPKIGCVLQTLLEWVKREEVESGQRDGLTAGEREGLKQLERENKELRRANDILKAASAFLPRQSSTAI